MARAELALEKPLHDTILTFSCLCLHKCMFTREQITSRHQFQASDITAIAAMLLKAMIQSEDPSFPQSL